MGKKSVNLNGLLGTGFLVAAISAVGVGLWEGGQGISNAFETDNLDEIYEDGTKYALYGANTILVKEGQIVDTFNFASKIALNHDTNQKFLFSEINQDWLDEVRKKGCEVSEDIIAAVEGYNSYSIFFSESSQYNDLGEQAEAFQKNYCMAEQPEF